MWLWVGMAVVLVLTSHNAMTWDGTRGGAWQCGCGSVAVVVVAVAQCGCGCVAGDCGCFGASMSENGALLMSVAVAGWLEIAVVLVLE
jgi:hypothetical protein